MATPGGFTYREITNIAKYIGKTVNVVGVDIMEWIPNKDVDNTTAKLALELILALFGANYSSYTEYLNTHKLQ